MATTELTKRHASGGRWTDTETVLSFVDGASSVDVVVHQVPGLTYWSRPSADIMRTWVDELIQDKDVKRSGARVETNPYGNAWRFTYYVRNK